MNAHTFARALEPAGRGWVQKAAELRRGHGIPYSKSLGARETLLHLVPSWVDFQTKLVLDLGANAGNWTAGVVAAVPGARVLAVEPFPDAYRGLTRRFADSHNVTLDSRAIGKEMGEAVFYVAAHDVFNSLLRSAASLHDLYGDQTAVLEEITVPVTTLDELTNGRPVSLMKVDVQGAELQVFAGGKQTLASTQAILVEANLVDLYEGGSTFPGVFQALTAAGFSLWNMAEPHRLSSGQPVYFDVLFARPPEPPAAD